MDYILQGHCFEDEVISIIQMFYPNINYNHAEQVGENGLCIKSIKDEHVFYAEVYENGYKISDNIQTAKSDEIKEQKRCIKLAIYNAVKKILSVKLPWGILTGIRPAKRVSDMWDNGFCDEEIVKSLKDDYLVSEDKIRLTIEVAKTERKILLNNNDNKIGLYIGIPFCPTRCLYCSFTSYPLDKYSSKVDDYLLCLEKELSFLGERFKGYETESIYIGGGTPAALNEEQLERLLEFVGKYFDASYEYSVEAGRPDTITRRKLRLLKQYGVNRISVNPQTMNEKTLRLIGREHTVGQFLSAFEMARQEGHKHINTDLILGLPEETASDVEKTMKEITNLNPESITIHTLAVKRASRLKENLGSYELAKYDEMERMLDVSSKYARGSGMFPYYMYRQKNMLGNFENVGYCKPGAEGIYNVQIMEEKQTIIAAGAGGSTKIYQSDKNNVERVFNVKSVDDYITRTDEMIQRKVDLFEKHLL